MASDKQFDAFDLDEAITALEATPGTLRALLASLPNDWLDYSEDEEAWSPRSVLIHFIHNEQTNWVPRARVILSDADDRTFAPFQQMPEESEFPPTETAQLIDQFERLRSSNLAQVREFGITDDDLKRQGEHPALGTVNLEQLISTWVTHDYNHLHQIAKSLAKRYRDAVGPWRPNLAILDI